MLMWTFKYQLLLLEKITYFTCKFIHSDAFFVHTVFVALYKVSVFVIILSRYVGFLYALYQS